MAQRKTYKKIRLYRQASRQEIRRFSAKRRLNKKSNRRNKKSSNIKN